MATSVLVTEASFKDILLACIFYIYYAMQFPKDDSKTQALFDSRSEIIIINTAYTRKLGFYIQKTNVSTQKIDESSLRTFEIAIASF